MYPANVLNEQRAYFEREVLPRVPDAWMDRSTDKVGYAINLDQHVYAFTVSRPVYEIDADLKRAEEESMRPRHEIMA